jgi:hypothetical protein
MSDPTYGYTPTTIPEFNARLNRWADRFPYIIRDRMNEEGKKIVYNIKYHFLSGQVLKVQTNRLRSSIKHEVDLQRKNAVLRFSEHGVSDKGFPYGAYWMDHGRDFMTRPIKGGMGRMMDKIAKSLGKISA